MSRKARRIVFYALVAVFFVAGPLVVFFSKGWRFDLEDFTLKKAGAIAVKTLPKDAKIYINNKEQKRKTGFLNETELFNLFPKNYSLKIAKEEFMPWENYIEVEEEKVAEEKNIILVPQKLEREKVAEGIEYFQTKGENVIIKDLKGNSLKEEKNIGKGDFISASLNFERILIYDKAKKGFFLKNLKEGSSLNLGVLLNNLSTREGRKDATVIKKAKINPDNAQEIVISTEKTFYLLNYEKMFLNILENESVAVFDFSGNEIVYGRREKIYSYNTASKEKKVLTDIKGEEASKIERSVEGVVLISAKSGALYVFSGTETEKISEQAQSFVLVNNKKVVFIENKQGEIKIVIIDLKNKERREALLGNKEVVTAIRCGDENHFFILQGQKILFIEIADKNSTLEGKILYQAEIDNRAISFYFNESGKTLFILNTKGVLEKINYFKEVL